MEPLQPFTIEISQPVLDDLKTRLRNTRWTDEPKDADWNYGTNPAYLRELIMYWIERYDWRKQEALLNKYPQFKVTVDGVEIHFIYVKGKGMHNKPLLLTHGWPDSFYRYYKLIPLLTDPAFAGADEERSFDLIIPSIPGFGFSGRVALSSERTASLWSALMTKVLGYKSYAAAGGDLGGAITKSLALNYPDEITAIHLTDVDYPNGAEDWSKLTQEEQEFGKFIQQWWMREGAYNMIQSTKPQTLGYGLNDSPAGLASWIVEKFNAWSDNKGNIENSFSKDELLTNVMIYWVTQTINTSIRTYAENARAMYADGGPKSVSKPEVPSAVAIFPSDAPIPKEWAARMVNLKRFTKMPRGGHFAALEEPVLLADDMRSFFWENNLS